MVISRCFGCTKLASANMAPYAAPPSSPTTMRRRIRLGIVATRGCPRPLGRLPQGPVDPAPTGWAIAETSLTTTFGANWQGPRCRGISAVNMDFWTDPDGRNRYAQCCRCGATSDRAARGAWTPLHRARRHDGCPQIIDRTAAGGAP